MANTIEISNDTILKLVVRSGTDSERQGVVLDVGELGYTTDHKRLFVGDAVTPGGVLVGNVFNGARTDVTAYTSTPQAGDFAFDTDTNTLYTFQGGNPSDINNWLRVGLIQSVADTTLSARDNFITVGSLSAYNISTDALGQSLDIDDSGRVTLSSSISSQNLTITQQTYLSESISISGIDYTWPASLSADGFLQTDGAGNLSWTSLNTLLCATSSSQITVGSGISLSANGVATTTTELITSAEIKIDTVHSPAAVCVFKQNGEITRGVGVSAVNIDSIAQILADSKTFAGLGFQALDAPLENTDGTGVYKIKLNQPYHIDGSDIDVDIKNASSYFTTNIAGTSAQETANFVSQNLEHGYYFVPRVGAPSTFDEIMVYFFVTRSTFTYNSGDKQWRVANLPAAITPGYDNSATRFKVSIYGDVV